MAERQRKNQEKKVMEVSTQTTSADPKVVIIGGGFGGLYAARILAGQPVDVTLIDRTNHHLFQPLLYQVATAMLSPADIAQPIRAILKHAKNIRVVMGRAESIHTAAKIAHTPRIGISIRLPDSCCGCAPLLFW